MNVCKRHVLICSKHIHLHIAIDVKTKTRDYIALLASSHSWLDPPSLLACFHSFCSNVHDWTLATISGLLVILLFVNWSFPVACNKFTTHGQGISLDALACAPLYPPPLTQQYGKLNPNKTANTGKVSGGFSLLHPLPFGTLEHSFALRTYSCESSHDQSQSNEIYDAQFKYAYS